MDRVVPLKLLGWGLGIVGAAALVLTTMIASPLPRLPELTSVSQAARAVDRSTMPSLERFSARDGTVLAYRHYPARGPASDKIAILVHGSSGSSPAVHALADALAARGVETYAPDIRGHGGSGMRGDVALIGQLENDIEDLVAVVRKTSPGGPLTLLGHSAGGGFALRLASSPIQDLFARTVLLAPYLGYDAPTNRPDSGGWARADIPRLIGLSVLRRLGILCCDIAADACLRGAGKLRTDTRVDLLLPLDAKFRDARLRGRFCRHAPSCHADFRRRR